MMRRRMTTCAAAAALCAGLLAGCSGGGGGSSSSSKSPSTSKSPAASHSPTASPTSAAGKVTSSSGHLDRAFLVDGKGRTLYLFEADTSGKSTCDGGCAKAWPPMTVTSTPKAGGDVRQSLLSTTTRNNGDKQVTYHGHPVYYYKGDSRPGETSGQGLNLFGAKWFVVTPAGNALKGKSSQSPSPSSGGNGY
jgi:predicted lipoprotein with Yx(FWY)xxD motif